MFRKRHVLLCACLSAMFSGVTPAAPSIADEPKHSIADAPRASIVDGESHEVRTRLGKFGPMATVKLPPFKVMPRFEGVTGYTDTGRPISRRKKLVLDQARARRSVGGRVSTGRQGRPRQAPTEGQDSG